MIWFAIIFGALLSFFMGVFFGTQKMNGAAIMCWLGGAFYTGYMLCLAITH